MLWRTKKTIIAFISVDIILGNHIDLEQDGIKYIFASVKLDAKSQLYN